jgi:endonuclease I
MKPQYLFILTAWLLSIATSRAQSLSVSTYALDWGTVTEATNNLTQSLTISNGTQVPLRVDSIKLFAMYGLNAGAVGQPFSNPAIGTGFDVLPGSNSAIPLALNPKHNLTHNSTFLVCGSGFPGCRSVDLKAAVAYRKAYYASTQNLWGQALLTALKTRVTQGNTLLSYNTARDRMFLDIDNKRTNGQGTTANTTECIYTGRETTNYTTRTDAQNDAFNTEHTFPQGFFGGTAVGPGTDLHHLFPTDETANGRRANFPFDTVTTTPTYAVGGSKLGSNNGITVFEPRAQQKGKTARAMCYFVLRHQDYSNFFAPQEALLRKWTANYLPDTVELRRNRDVETYQGNRNPFIDYPQLLDRIPSLVNPNLTFPVLSKAAVYPATATLAADDTTGYFFALINEGNQNLQLPPMIAPAGFRLVRLSASTGSVLEVGKGITYRIIPTTAQPGTYSYSPYGTTQISLTLTGPTATGPKTPDPLIRLSIFPNPASGVVTIRTSYPVAIYDLMGRPKYQGPAGSINIAAWARGVYVVSAGSQLRRLVVE